MSDKTNGLSPLSPAPAFWPAGSFAGAGTFAGAGAAFTAEEQGRVAQRLQALWAARILAYTSGESASVPEETARRLLNSMLYTLGRYLGESGRWRELLTRPGADVLTDARHRLERDLSRANALWRGAVSTLPPYASAPCRETLAELGAFFRRYDRLYFAGEMPASVSYFLAMPVEESLGGVDYVEAYLRRLLAENRLLAPFDEAEARRLLLRAQGPGWQETPLNLAEAVLTQALGAALAGQPGSLSMAGPRRQALADAWPREEAAARARLDEAARALAETLHADGGGLALVLHIAGGLAPRLAAARGAGFAGIFFLL